MPRRPVSGQDESSGSQPEDAGSTSGPTEAPGRPLAVEAQENAQQQRADEEERGEDRKAKRKRDGKEKHGKKKKKEEKNKKRKKEKKAGKDKQQLQSSTKGRAEVVEELDLDQLLAGSDLLEASMATEPSSTFADSQDSAMQSGTDDPAGEQRRKISKLLADAGGELHLGALEQLLSKRLHKEALTDFVIVSSVDGNSSKDLVRLTSKQACQLLEGPSLQMAYLEDMYFALGDAVLQAGLDFDNEEKFRNLFDDLLAKREEVKRAARRNSFMPYVPRSRASKRSRKDLPPMTQFEKNLLHDIQRVLKARQAKESWIPLSELLEDPVIRRARCKLPRGLALWEWLSLRCAEITMVNERSDMLLQMATASGPADSLQMTLEERKQELSLAVYETLAILQRSFPDGGGLSLEDLQQVPAVARLQFGRPALQQALSRMKTVKVLARADGQQMVQLRPVSEVLGQETREPEQARDKPAPKEASTSRAKSNSALAAGRSLSSASLTTTPTTQGQPPDLPDRLPVTVHGWSKVQEHFFKGWPQLPDGWIRVISRSTGKVFFVNLNNTGGVGHMELPQESERNDVESFRQMPSRAMAATSASR